MGGGREPCRQRSLALNAVIALSTVELRRCPAGITSPGLGSGWITDDRGIGEEVVAQSDSETDGRITDEAVEDLRGWLGVARRERGWNSGVTEDAVWHFALGVGDDNPLWWDRS